MTTTQARWTTGRMLVVVVEVIVALIGAALAGMPQGERMDRAVNLPQTHGKPRAKAAQGCGNLGSLTNPVKTEVCGGHDKLGNAICGSTTARTSVLRSGTRQAMGKTCVQRL